jgi:uncharacterized SAM-binding protein YcdF (DUF218 family)
VQFVLETFPHPAVKPPFPNKLAQLLAHPRRRPLLALTALLLAGYLLLPTLLNAAARKLLRVDELSAADVIVALGGDPRCWRERQAAELYHRGFGRKIVISSTPFAWGGNTGAAVQRYLVCRGVPARDLIMLKDVYNTRAEAEQLIPLMRAQGWRSALVVTSPFHSRRALYTLERYAPDLQFSSVPLPAAPPEWQPERWWTRRSDVGVTIREWLSWANTLVRGWQ